MLSDIENPKENNQICLVSEKTRFYVNNILGGAVVKSLIYTASVHEKDLFVPIDNEQK